MDGCECPHPAAEHGTAAEFGTAMCLVFDCDCQGTKAQVAALAAERAKRESVPEALVALIAEVLSNRLPRTVDDMARNLAQAILGEFDVEAR